MSTLKVFITSMVILLLSACSIFAVGPKYSTMQTTLPVLSKDNGRIFFYRSDSLFGAGIQPQVKLNGAVVGESKPGGFFYVDRKSGDYEVVLTSEVDKKLTFRLDKGQTRYVKMTVGMGVLVYRVYPELIDPATAKTDMQELSYMSPVASK